MSFMESSRAVTADVRAAITELCTEYVFRLDNGFAERVTELFTEDATWDGPHGSLRGRAELDRVWRERAKRTVRTRHLISNVRLAWSAQDVLHGWISFTLFKAEAAEAPLPVPSMVAEHVDTYGQGADGRWRFRSRRVSMAFYDEVWAPANAPAS